MEVTRHRKASPLRHKIHMPDGVWTYRIGCKFPGCGGGATIRNPDCELTGKIDMSELTGWSWPALERESWKSPETLPQVKPSDIRLLIENIQKRVYEIKTTSTPKGEKRCYGLQSKYRKVSHGSINTGA